MSSKSLFHLKNVAVLVGLSSLMAFTLVTTLIAIASRGALIYFYEPNTTIWVLEVFIGLYGIVISMYLFKNTLEGVNK